VRYLRVLAIVGRFVALVVFSIVLFCATLAALAFGAYHVLHMILCVRHC
jgi:hypothetical protein